jgi:hypothetical protein
MNRTGQKVEVLLFTCTLNPANINELFEASVYFSATEGPNSVIHVTILRKLVSVIHNIKNFVYREKKFLIGAGKAFIPFYIEKVIIHMKVLL